jgi:peptide/nickel transport system permease protein
MRSPVPVIRIAVRIIILFAVVGGIALFPVIVNSANGEIQLQWPKAADQLRRFGAALREGTVLSYTSGRLDRNLSDTLPRYFLNSCIFVLSASIPGLLIGIFAGLNMALKRRTALFESFVLFGLIPSFVLAFLLQFLAIEFYQRTGIRLARVARLSVNNPALLLPAVTLCLTSSIYLIRSIMVNTRKIVTEDYIAFAVAKGLGNTAVYYRHVFPGLLHALKADLHGFLGIIIANLFILERIFAIPGITQLIFTFAFTFYRDYRLGETVRLYQFNLVIVGFAGLMTLYFLVYQILRLLLLAMNLWARNLPVEKLKSQAKRSKKMNHRKKNFSAGA